MGLGGVIFASLGIVVTVLVANGRWSTVWAAMLGAGSPVPGTTGGGWGPPGDGSTLTTTSNAVGGNSVTATYGG